MREDIIGYENLRLSTFEFEYLKEFNIENKVNSHSIMKVSAIVSEDVKDMYLHYISEQTSIMAYYLKEEDAAETIFSGVITKCRVKSFNNTYLLELEAKDISIYLDIYKIRRTYQNINMTSHEIINNIMSSYNYINYHINIPNEAIGSFILQYDETDFEFLVRLLSRYNEMIYITPDGEHFNIHFGIPNVFVKLNEEINYYSVSKNIEEHNLSINNNDKKVIFCDYTTYKINIASYLNIGESFNFKNNKYYIMEAIHSLEDGIIKNEYCMRVKEGLKINRIYNDKLIGISLFGYISQVQRDRVKVNLEIEDEKESSELYWFPYASIAASPNGGGWYCMPEIGERVRINLPDKDEGKAFVINAIDGHEASEGDASDRMSNPDNKSLQTNAGQEVQFTPEGVTISATDGVAEMKLNNDGTVNILGKKKINISCCNNLMIRAENEINIKSKDTVDIICNAGGELKINKSDNIVMKANRILNNG